MSDRRIGIRLLLPAIALLASSLATAQTSSSYKLTESTINGGGNPRDGIILSSSSFHVTLDSIGDASLGTGLASASFRVNGGFASGCPPPGEVRGVSLDGATLHWSPEPSAGVYQVYRGLISTLPGTFGTCFAGNVAAPTITDASNPAAGQAYFYLVTVRNRLGEEGPKGYRSDGTLEGNPSPCP